MTHFDNLYHVDKPAEHRTRYLTDIIHNTSCQIFMQVVERSVDAVLFKSFVFMLCLAHLCEMFEKRLAFSYGWLRSSDFTDRITCVSINFVCCLFISLLLLICCQFCRSWKNMDLTILLFYDTNVCFKYVIAKHWHNVLRCLTLQLNFFFIGKHRFFLFPLYV